MARRKPRKPRLAPSAAQVPGSLGSWMHLFLADLTARNYSPATVEGRESYLALFLDWCQERGLIGPEAISRPILQSYQRHLFHFRRPDGSRLSARGQVNRLLPLKAFFRWLTRQEVLAHNPAADLDLPRLEKRLPRHVLSPAEAEAVLAGPDLATSLGLRDRAILEVLWSTGMRRMELANLRAIDLDGERGTVMVRQGKGKKDRLIPIGERAAAWCERYLCEVRPWLAVPPDPGTLFLTHRGETFTPDRLTQLVGAYVDRAELGKRGACHLFRHAMATAMLENGADLRFIQEMLGHAELSTTQIYTQVAIRKLKEIHTATHPAARLERPEPTGPPGPEPPGTMRDEEEPACQAAQDP